MTFEEYLRQQDPKRHPTVYIKRSDCYIYHEGSLPYGKALIGLKIHGEYYTYILDKDSDVLWTMDEDGNRKNRSCFKFIKDEKRKKNCLSRRN